MKRISDKTDCTIQVKAILKDGKYVGKVISHYSKNGVCTVELYDNCNLLHAGKAGGYGYDKFTCALSGAKFHDLELVDNCQVKIEHKDGSYSHKKAGLDLLYEHGYQIICLI